MYFDSKVGIISAKRLPIGKIYGSYSQVSPEKMYQNIIEQQFSNLDLLDQSIIDQIILGNVTNQGGNIARRCALAAGFSISIPAFSIDNQCGSGLTAIITAAQAIKSKASSIICTGGVESTSTAHVNLDYVTREPIKRFRMAPDPFVDLDMGVIADLAAKKWGITRSSLDLYAFRSHQKAAEAIYSKKLINEILPFSSGNIEIKIDQAVRFDTTLEKMTELSNCFTPFGTTTAGNSCPISDGVSSIVLSDSSLDFNFCGYYLDQVTVGVAPEDFLEAPIQSTEKLLQKYHLNISQIEAIELNEAFSVQAILFKNHFLLDDQKLNGFGGALAFGHPYGATGGILIARLINRLNQVKYPALGIATLCVAGGMGISVLLANQWWKF